MPDPVRIGVVGLGNFGRLHAQTLNGLGEAMLVGIVDRCSKAMAAGQAEFAGVPSWNDLHQALQECDAEAWVVASSTVSHAAIAKLILATGRPVLIEKPIADSLEAAADLAPWVATDSSNLMLGHIVLFNSEFQQLRDEAQRRKAISYIDCVRHRPIGTRFLFPGESPFHLTMIHDLYCVLALTNREEPDRLTAQVHRTADGACDLALAQLQWKGGAVASLTASFLTPEGMAADGFDRLEVFGEGWSARAQSNPRPLELWDDRARWPLSLEIRSSPKCSSGMLAEELRSFCRVVRRQQEVPMGATYHDAMQIQRWLDQLIAIADPK